MTQCSIEGCQGNKHAKGLCKHHYQTQWRTGKTDLIRPVFRGNKYQRLEHYSRPSDCSDCIVWIGHKDKDGYGAMRDGKKMVRPHRVAYEKEFGAIPEGMSVLHKCNNPDCVNPAHLYLGDHSQNMKDRLKSGNYATGERHPNSKFSDETVNLIRMESGTNKYISQKYGVSVTQVRNIRSFAQRSA